MKVLIADKFEKVGIDGLKELGCTVVSQPDLTADELPAAIREVDPHILIVRGTKVTADALKAGTALTLVIRAGRGHRHHRRDDRVEPRHLRLQLSGQELDRGGRAGDGAAARLRPPDPRPGGRPAPGQVEQGRVLQGAGALRPDPRHRGAGADRPRDRGPGAGVRHAGAGLVAQLTHEEADRLGIAYAQTPAGGGAARRRGDDQRRRERRDQAPGERRVPRGDAAGRVPHQHLPRLGGGRGGAARRRCGRRASAPGSTSSRTSPPGAPASSRARSSRRPGSTAPTTSAPRPIRPRWPSPTR